MKKTTTDDLLLASIKEQQFYRLKSEYLLLVLHEIRSFTTPLEQAVIDNALERQNLDNLIHAKLIFK